MRSVNQRHISVSGNKWKRDKLDGLKQVKSVHKMPLGLVGKSVPTRSVSLVGKHGGHLSTSAPRPDL